MKIKLQAPTIIILVFILISSVGCQTWSVIPQKRLVLWEIVHQRCGTALDKKNDCLVMQPDYIVLRDINGPVQTLIIPTQRVTGIEDPALLQPTQPNYFAQAWQHREILDQQNHKAIDPRYLSFTVNSKFGRTQDQLHVHSSCLRPDVYQILIHHRAQISDRWQIFPQKIFGHTYWAKRVALDHVLEQSPFIDLATNLKQPNQLNMAQYGIGMVSIIENEVILLASKVNELEVNRASVEELQDTHCSITQHQSDQF